ncbi:MAG: trigger factor [Spiroplasma sp.]|nr:trigger factor [Spiroplasma sp.]
MKEYKNIELVTKKIPVEGLGQWIVTISGNDWAKILSNSETNLKADLQVPGFRKGKVPANIAKKHIKPAAILKKASSLAIKIAYQYGLDQKDLDVKVTNKPGVEVTQLSQELCQLTFNFDLPLEVKLDQYRNFAIIKPEVAVSQDEIDQQVKILKDRFAIYRPKEKGSLVIGDIAIFDFKGELNGQEFPGNQGKDTQLEIGTKQFIPGFEEQMVGMKPNQTKTIKVTFPKDYHVENLANQEAEFTIHLKEIKIKIPTESNDELVKDVNIPNVNTYPELLDYIKKQLEEQKSKTVKDQFFNQLFTEILKSTVIVVPNSLIDKETDRLVNDFKSQLKQQNLSFEEYQKITKVSEQDIRKEAQKDALWELQVYILTEEIAKAEKITASQSEIDQYLNNISAQFNISVEEIKKSMKDLTFVISNVRRSKTLDWLWDNNGSQEILEEKLQESETASSVKSTTKKN